MKVIGKVKKCLIGIGTFFVAIKTKVLADTLRAEEPISLYGVEDSGGMEMSKGVRIAMLIMMPISIGIVIRTVVKSKKSKSKKIIVAILGSLLIISWLGWGVWQTY